MGVRTEKLERALRKAAKDLGRIGKIQRWLATTNDFNGGDEWTSAERTDALRSLFSAKYNISCAIRSMMKLKAWQEAHE